MEDPLGGSAPPPPYDSVVLPAPSDGATDDKDADGAGGALGRGSSELAIKVYDPVKQGDGIGAYVSYRVESKTSLPQFAREENEVIRRFKDFAWLQDKLAEKNPGVIIPPLPEKDVVQKFSMASDFIHKRCSALDVFLNRVAAHPSLRHCSELQFFLEADELAWQNEVAKAQAQQNAAAKALKGTKNFFKGLGRATNNALSGKSADVDEDPEYIQVRTYVGALETHLGELYRHAERLTNKQSKLNQSVDAFGASLAALAGGKVPGSSADDEGSPEPPPMVVGTPSDAAQRFARVASGVAAISAASGARLDKLELEFVEPMKEYARFVRSVRNVVADRTEALQRRQQKQQSVENKKQSLAKLRATPGAKEEKLSLTEQKLNESARKLDEAKDRYALIKERMRSELRQYHETRKDDMVATLRNFAQSQESLAAEQAEMWKGLVKELTA